MIWLGIIIINVIHNNGIWQKGTYLHCLGPGMVCSLYFHAYSELKAWFGNRPGMSLKLGLEVNSSFKRILWSVIGTLIRDMPLKGLFGFEIDLFTCVNRWSNFMLVEQVYLNFESCQIFKCCIIQCLVVCFRFGLCSLYWVGGCLRVKM